MRTLIALCLFGFFVQANAGPNSSIMNVGLTIVPRCDGGGDGHDDDNHDKDKNDKKREKSGYQNRSGVDTDSCSSDESYTKSMSAERSKSSSNDERAWLSVAAHGDADDGAQVKVPGGPRKIVRWMLKY